MKKSHNPQDVLRRLIQWAEGRDAVRAMLLTSTRAIPDAKVDIFSDYDVILVVEDVHPFYVDRTWLNDFGEVLVTYWDPICTDPDVGFEQTTNVIQFADGLHIDFTLWPVGLWQSIAAASSLLPELDAGYRVLLDKDHLTDNLPVPTFTAYIPTPPSHEFYQLMIEEFFSDAPYVAKCLWRDELLPAKWCLDCDMKHKYLRQMLEWYVGITHDWSVSTRAMGKGLKKQLPPDLWAQLEETYVGADLAENWQALYQTMRLFRQVASEVGAHLGYAYPHDLDERVTAFVQNMQP